MKYYKINYEVDTGWDYCRDTAIVRADTEDVAVEKIKSYISSIANDCMVSNVFYVRELTDDVFSNLFKPKAK